MEKLDASSVEADESRAELSERDLGGAAIGGAAQNEQNVAEGDRGASQRQNTHERHGRIVRFARGYLVEFEQRRN